MPSSRVGPKEEAMYTILIGLIGYNALFFMGRRIYLDPAVTPRRFAITVSCGLALVHLAMALAAAPLSDGLVFAAVIVTITPIFVGYPLVNYLGYPFLTYLDRRHKISRKQKPN